VKLRLILKTFTKKNKELQLKFKIAPSKHIGFINFINLALNQKKPVKLSFELQKTDGNKEAINLYGTFSLEEKQF
jgi:hypothetical protein